MARLEVRDQAMDPDPVARAAMAYRCHAALESSALNVLAKA
jgi:hypothetical protein